MLTENTVHSEVQHEMQTANTVRYSMTANTAHSEVQLDTDCKHTLRYSLRLTANTQYTARYSVRC